MYTFSNKNKGYIGEAFEMSIKNAIGAKNADVVSSAGKCDFRYNGKCYDVKQNGSIIQYSPNATYVKGSSRVIFASHVAFDVVAEDAETVSIDVRLQDTEFFVVDKKQFVKFLLENGYAKINQARGQVNIQTCYNYKKNAYHGAIGKKIEAWCAENSLEDDIIDII